MNKKKETKPLTEDWKKLYQSEEEKYKKYLEAIQIANLTEIAQQSSSDFSKEQILTDY